MIIAQMIKTYVTTIIVIAMIAKKFNKTIKYKLWIAFIFFLLILLFPLVWEIFFFGSINLIYYSDFSKIYHYFKKKKKSQIKKSFDHIVKLTWFIVSE